MALAVRGTRDEVMSRTHRPPAALRATHFDFLDEAWVDLQPRTSDTTTTHERLSRADPALIHIRTARGYSLRVDGKSQSWVRLPRKWQAEPGAAAFLPRSVRLQIAGEMADGVAAPKNKKVEKMSLGDFLGDQSRRHQLLVVSADD